jgi:hypothetical protein
MKRRLRYYWDLWVLLGVPTVTLLAVLWWFGVFDAAMQITRELY